MTKKRTLLRLKPSARDKRRYFLVKEKTSHKKIKEAIKEYIGILGLAETAYKEIHEKNIKGHAIASCTAEKLEHVRAALALQHIEITKVSGTIKGLTK